MEKRLWICFSNSHKILAGIGNGTNSMSRKEGKKRILHGNVSTKIYTNSPPPVDKNRAVKVEAERGNISRRGGTWYESPPSCITEIARKIPATRGSKIGGGRKKEKREMPRNCAKFCRSIVFPNKIEGFTTRSADTPFTLPNNGSLFSKDLSRFPVNNCFPLG